jgi:hypothetical protein
MRTTSVLLVLVCLASFCAAWQTTWPLGMNCPAPSANGGTQYTAGGKVRRVPCVVMCAIFVRLLVLLVVVLLSCSTLYFSFSYV